MLELRLKVTKTELKVVSMPEPFTEGLKNYAKVVFEFGTDWDGLGKLATFKRVLDQHTVTVNVANNECIIPYEVFAYPQVEISVIGRSQEKTITSTVLRFDVKRNLGEGGSPQPETPDIFDQILEASQAAEDMANQVYQDAQAGKFNGADGQDGETPTIGANGNWFVGEVDTGKPSRGEDGTDGLDGQDGADGKAATVKVGTVTTGEAGTQASVTNSGTETDAVLDFVIPRGADGGGVSGDYLPTTGGTLTGNLAVNTGTTEPNVTLNRTVDNAPCELTARIDSEAKAGLRYKVSGQIVNELILEQTKTRFRKPLDMASGGVPIDGAEGQVLTKNASGHAWADLPDILDPQEIRDMINAPVIEVQGETAKLKAPDETPVILGIEGGGTGASTAVDALKNLGAVGNSVLRTISAAQAGSDVKSLPAGRHYLYRKTDSLGGYSNLPSDWSNGHYGLLEVITFGLNNSRILYLTSFNSGESYICTINSDSTLSDWKRVTNATDLANYLPLTGGTLTKSLTIDDNSNSGFQFQTKRTVDSKKYSTRLGTLGDGSGTVISYNETDSAYVNRMYLLPDRTEFYKPVDIPSGGTGQTTAKAAQHALLSDMNRESDPPTDDSKLVFAYDASTANNGAVFKRPLSAVWTWIESKADSIYAAKSHTHEISNVNGLQSALESKANATHTHTTNDVSNMYSGFAEHAAMEAYNVFTLTVSDLDFDPRNAKIFLADMSVAPNPGEKCSQVAVCNMTENSFQIMGYAGTGAIKIGWTAIV